MNNHLVVLTYNGVQDKRMDKFQEIKGLKDYLQYLTLKK